MKELKYHHLRASLPVTNSGEQERLCDIKYVILREGDVYKNQFAEINYDDLFNLFYRFSVDGKKYQMVDFALNASVSREHFQIHGFTVTGRDEEKVSLDCDLKTPWVLFSGLLDNVLYILPEPVFKALYAKELGETLFWFDIQDIGEKHCRLIFDDNILIDLFNPVDKPVKFDALRKKKDAILAFLEREFDRMLTLSSTPLAPDYTFAHLVVARQLTEAESRMDNLKLLRQSGEWKIDDHIYYVSMSSTKGSIEDTHYAFNKMLGIKHLTMRELRVSTRQRQYMDKFLDFYYFMLGL